MKPDMTFEFGRNWAAFSRHKLDHDHVAQARADFAALFDGVELNGKTFLDIGFGQGLSLLVAAASSAHATGCDIDPLCAKILRRNSVLFPEVGLQDIRVITGSILDPDTQENIRSAAKNGFDIVHSWGALHHTGDLNRAFCTAAELVATGGHLVIAIYNHHWSSPLWLPIKWLYCSLPEFGRRLMIGMLSPIIWVAKLIVTGRNPSRMRRGMDFRYDVIDWVGGYPYEYATVEEVQELAEKLGFEYVRHRPPRVPTGCNEYVFRKSRS